MTSKPYLFLSKKRIVPVCRRIVLKPEWDQVQLPPSPVELLRAVVMDAS
ncbi:hypothetical protein [Cohnella thermotolerans]|nr:hypothetical protein [Cohnella thermotolerans]